MLVVRQSSLVAPGGCRILGLDARVGVSRVQTTHETPGVELMLMSANRF